ncbi:hypothetical protein NB640_12715 [Oxalobacter vibrioformis]|uniref:Uncharacterized protein n=1 Tax=Oxalobacter vibrioformis TaxID=933080 RepID=A0A9E9LZ23_9BURK|nr:hypothetical protein [Oxalobacter vibrioformis]WAW11372.1 hypothetical protein NB640_12715 [Oxalobacter vibrioformis]
MRDEEIFHAVQEQVIRSLKNRRFRHEPPHAVDVCGIASGCFYSHIKLEKMASGDAGEKLSRSAISLQKKS